MSMVKINCPQCLGMGLTGKVQPFVVCTECGGSGVITVDDSQSLATINTASATPIVDTSASSTQSSAQENLQIEQAIDPNI